MKHHFEISRHLRDLDNDQIVDLGAALGIKHPKLMRMRILPGDMVAAWLRREDDVLDVGDPSWKILSEALKNCGQKGLAREIQQKYQRGMYMYDSIIQIIVWYACHWTAFRLLKPLL